MQPRDNSRVCWQLLYGTLCRNGPRASRGPAPSFDPFITLEEFDEMDTSRDVKIQTVEVLNMALEEREQLMQQALLPHQLQHAIMQVHHTCVPYQLCLRREQHHMDGQLGFIYCC